jgi:hypothetical protein
MRRTLATAIALAALSATASPAQNWELGGFGGFGIANNLTASTAASSATAGIKDGSAWGVWGGQNGRILGGELRYTQRKSDLKLTSGTSDVGFSARSHLIHYDALLHALPQRSRVRPFFAFGGGIRVYESTGVENAFQPLSSFALLTDSREVLPLLSLGGGLKVRITNLVSLRTEVRDYVTTAPEGLITPAPGARIKGWIHDVVPSVGIALTF